MLRFQKSISKYVSHRAGITLGTNLSAPGQITYVVDFLSENKEKHPLQRTNFCVFQCRITVYLMCVACRDHMDSVSPEYPVFCLGHVSEWLDYDSSDGIHLS